jgi:diguanylate cyclase (GGDEF)-like protein/PAS domain S-box-containing protein
MSAIEDPARLAALRATGLLDSEAEACFDRFTRLAQRIIGAPVVLVSLVDERRQFFKSAVGLDEPWASRRETDLSMSFCQHVVAASAPLVIEDATAHPLVRTNLAVTELGIRAYVGVPLVAGGHDIGAFCACDTATRRWSRDDLDTLQALADSVQAEIDLRIALAREREQEAVLRALFEGSALAIGLAGLDGILVRANPAFERLLGYTEAELRGRRITDLSPPEDRAREHALITGETRAGVGGHRDKRYLRKDGSVFWGRVHVDEVRDRDGRVLYLAGMIIDITAEKEVGDALALSDQTHRAIVANLPRGAVLMVDAGYRYVAASGPALPDILRLAQIDAIIGRTVHDLVAGPEAAAILERYRLGFAGVEQQFDVAFADRTYEGRMVPLRDAADQVTHVLVVYDDVTARDAEARALRDANAALGLERELFRTTLRHLRDGVALVGVDRRVMLANTTYCAMLDVPPDRVIGLTMHELAAHLAPRVTDPDGVEAILAEQPSETAKHEIVIARPRRRVLERTFSPLSSADGAGFLAVWRDITAERDLADERDRQIYTDVLTGIPNRRAADKAFAVEVSRQRRTQSRLSVALFDLDHFKRINDVHGHVAGDDVLRHVGETLSREARITDTVARWGGEEFIAILPVGLDGAVVFCERIRAAIEQLALPVGPITISVGVAELADGDDASTAIARADANLYAAKRGGRNRVAAAAVAAVAAAD